MVSERAPERKDPAEREALEWMVVGCCDITPRHVEGIVFIELKMPRCRTRLFPSRCSGVIEVKDDMR
jgi:hypothetical protein